MRVQFTRGNAARLFKHYFAGPTNATVTCPVQRPNYINTGLECALQTYSVLIQFLLQRYVTENNIANLCDDVRY